MHLAQSLASLLLTALVPLWALLLGYPLLRFISMPPGTAWSGQSVALSLALGWGLLSHLIWFLAAAGSFWGINLLRPWIILPLLAITGILSWRSIASMARKACGEMLRIPAVLNALPPLAKMANAIPWLLLGLILARIFLAAFTPSFLYDVLEYHIPEAQRLAASGSLQPIPGNSYSLMPQGVEILFALGTVLEGGVSSYAPKLIHLYLGLSAALLLYALLKRFSTPFWLRGLALLLFLSHPISFKLFADAYVDFGPALYGTASILCGLLPNPREAAKCSLLSGVFLGFALSAKYTVLGVLILPYLFILAPCYPEAASRSSPSAPRRHFATISLSLLCGAAALLTYSPWLLRALAVDGSPFPPLTLPGWWASVPSDALGLRSFMAHAHGLVSPLDSAFWQAVMQRISAVGTIFFAAPLFFLIRPRGDPRLRRLSGLVLTGYLLWNLRTDSADRFLSPLLPTFIALGVLLIAELCRRLPRFSPWLVAPFAIWLMLQIAPQTRHAFQAGWISGGLGLVSKEDLSQRQMGMAGRFFDAINDATRATANPKVLLLYEARSGALDAPSISNTVFDPCLLWLLLQTDVGENPEALLRALQQKGITHIAVNEVEMARLVRTYPAPQAQEVPGFRALAELPAPAGYHPAYLAWWKYYPPFFYQARIPMEETKSRLDRFLEMAQQHAIWEENLAGARLWVAPLNF